LQFGAHIHVHEPHNNSSMPRTADAIAPHPTGKGLFYFLTLHSGKRIIRNIWTVLPMPAEEIKKYKGIVYTDKIEMS